MSDTHKAEPRWIIRRAKHQSTTGGMILFHVIDTNTDLSYGCYEYDSAKRIAARLNGQEED
jgi:hypothetical protein